MKSFMDLTGPRADPVAARYAVLPAPYEGTACYRRGTAAGPAAILDASPQLEFFDEELGAEFLDAGIATYPAVPPADDPSEQMRRVHTAAAAILKAGQFLLTLGGEHSITAPLVQAVIEGHGPVSVLQIDAHADLRDSYEGTKHSTPPSCGACSS